MLHLVRATALIVRTAPGSTALFLGLTLLAASLPPVQIWLTKALIDRVAGGVPAESAKVIWAIALLAVVWLASEASGGWATTLQQLIAFRVSSATQQRLLRQAFSVDYAMYEDPRAMDRLTMVRGRAESAAVNACFAIADLLKAGLSLGAVVILLARLSPLAALVVVAFSVPKIVWGMEYSRRYFRQVNQETEDHRRAAYLAHTLSAAQAAKEIRLFMAGHMLLRRHADLYSRFLRETRALLFGMQSWSALCALASAAAVAGVWWYAVNETVAGRASLGDLALYLQAAVACSVGLASVGGSVRELNENRLHLAEVFRFLALPPAATQAGPAAVPTVTRRPPLRESIEFRDVWFRYPGTETMVLAGVSLRLPARTTMGLVGVNGCGKTTLVKLLTRLYDPVQGEILLDGVPLARIPVEEHWSRIGVVFQDFVKYELSLADNVAIGCPDRAEDEARLRRAIEKGGAGSLLAKMPGGLNTILSRYFTGGVDLSVGEWQRVAMARAFAREEADLLVLDEPTASMDVFAEQRIYADFAALTEGRTALLVSHRLSSVRRLTAVAVMDQGRITECGPHQELMAAGGLYSEMFSTQARQYGVEYHAPAEAPGP